MRRMITGLTVILMGLAVTANAQLVIDDFDDLAAADTIYEVSVEAPPSAITLSAAADFAEGTGAIDVDAVIGEFHQWGSFAQLIYRIGDGEPTLDWYSYDTLSIWIKVREAPTHPEWMVFRIHLADRPTPDDAIEEYIYEHATILDAVSEWVELRIPLYEMESDGSRIPDDLGFTRSPDSWGGFTYNDYQLNFDKLVGFNIGTIVSGWDPSVNLPADSLVVSFDNMTLQGARAVPVVFFNGKSTNSAMSSFTWGQSSLEVEEGTGATAGTNAIKWTQGNEWGNGWSGAGWNVDPPFNLAGAWATDTLKFKMKADTGTGAIRVQFEDGTNKIGKVFDPIADGAWHDFAFPLDSLDYQEGSMSFDSSAITVIQFMGEGSAIAGKVVYIDDFWTGSPVIDVVAPAAVASVTPVVQTYYNLITWPDVSGESGEVYTVYGSSEPITDVSDSLVFTVEIAVAEGVQSAAHWLTAPLVDTDVSYYYAVVCYDEAGNESPLTATTSAFTNTAMGIPTISLNPPASFAADGDLAEWDASGIMPFELSPTTHFVPAGAVDDAADLSATIYLAADNENLYVAADVIDNVFNSGAGNWWDQDAFEFYIGLYDWQTGKMHSSPSRSTDEPDYKLIFAVDGLVNEWNDWDTLGVPGDGNYHFEELGGQDYIIEAVIPFDSITVGDGASFTPASGMRIPIELYIHDNDGTWEGNLAFSRNNTDQAWNNPREWTFTWVGDEELGISDDAPLARAYSLEQNYPNPFNPSTTITYTLARAGEVRMEIYNLLGKQVTTLINEYQSAGQHKFILNGTNMASGIYFYRIQSGEFSQTRKMVLLK